MIIITIPYSRNFVLSTTTKLPTYIPFFSFLSLTTVILVWLIFLFWFVFGSIILICVTENVKADGRTSVLLLARRTLMPLLLRIRIVPGKVDWRWPATKAELFSVVFCQRSRNKNNTQRPISESHQPGIGPRFCFLVVVVFVVSTSISNFLHHFPKL